MSKNTNDLIQELTTRGFVYQHSCELEKILGTSRKFYLGVDPTADSIHLGNLVAYMLALHLVEAGHKAVLLVGGATSMIGDPSFKDSERNFLSIEDIKHNSESITKQIKQIIGLKDIEVVNNYDWLSKINILDFLRDTGKHFTINSLIKKESIAQRIQGDNGISFTEFTYTLLQGYDFYYLNKEKKVDLQIGGSDQWGNILSGVELIRRKSNQEAYAMTLPLIIDKSSGKKFGKSEGNAVWLDPQKTSPYAFYQFWLNVEDINVIDYLKLFTFLSLTEIAKLEKAVAEDPGERLAQKTIAYEVTKFIHGEDTAKNAKIVSEIIFGEKGIENINKEQEKMLLTEAPVCEVNQEINIIDLLIKADLASSKREAREFLNNKAVKLNGEILKIDDVIKEKGIYLLARGKKKKSIIKFE